MTLLRLVKRNFAINRQKKTGALSQINLEVIQLFVQLSRALAHPCKIYNILAVGAPVIYIGPKPSHVTEILDRLGDEHPSIRVAHGETNILANQIQALSQKIATCARPSATTFATSFPKGILLPKLIAAVEGTRHD